MSTLSPNSCSQSQPARRGKRLAVGFCGVSLLAGVLLWQRRPVPVPAPVVVDSTPVGETLPEAERTELVLKEGRLHLGDVIFTGLMVEHYPGGVLKSRTGVSNGLLHGVSEGWFTNAVRQVAEHFVNGVSHGERLRWDEEGRQVAAAQIDQGKIVGQFRRWHANGQLAEEVTMKNGEPDGLARSWYASGSLQAEVKLEQGKVLEQHRYKEGESRATTGPLAKISPP